MAEKETEKVLDLRGWSHPWCILKVKSWLGRMAPGERLEVLCTDPLLRTSFPTVFERTGHRPLSWENREDHFSVIIMKGDEKEAHE